MNIKKTFSLVLLAAGVPLLYTRCVPHRLDEAVLYRGPLFELKVVRYFENLPLHYRGESYRVMCRSPYTAEAPELDRQDRGWNSIANGDAGDDSAAALATLLAPDFLVFDDRVLVYTSGRRLGASFDACKSFRYWDPVTLPASMIEPVEMDDSCQPEGLRDCRYLYFSSDRRPGYDAISADAQGNIRFRCVPTRCSPTVNCE